MPGWPRAELDAGPRWRGCPRLRALPVAERLSSPRIGLLWLARLRWHALGAIALAMTLAPWLRGVSVPWRPAFALVGGSALSNLACALWTRSERQVAPAVCHLQGIRQVPLLIVPLEHE